MQRLWHEGNSKVPSPSPSPRSPWHRLRDDERKSPAVVQYLNAENDHTRAVMADTEKLQVAAPTCTCGGPVVVTH